MFPFHTHPEERLWLPTSSCFKHWGHCSVQGIHATLASARVSFSPHSNCHFCNDHSSSDFHRLNFSDDDRFWVLLHIPVCLHAWPTSFLRSSLVILFTYWVIWALHWFPFPPILEAVSSCCTFSLDYIWAWSHLSHNRSLLALASGLTLAPLVYLELTSECGSWTWDTLACRCHTVH